MTATPSRRDARIEQLVARLRATLEGARSMPMSASAVVNRGELLDLVDQIETALTAVSADDGTAVGAEGRDAADRQVAEAEQERDSSVSEAEVVRLARRQADQMIEEATREAEELRRESDEYVDGRLANLEVALNRTLEAVKRGRDRLHDRSDLSRFDSSEHDESPFFAADDP